MPSRQATFEITPGLLVNADERLVRIMMENLLGNAWKFTSKRPETLIEVGAIELDGQRTFFVRDDGVGVDLTATPDLFGAFQRGHSSAEFEGAGIGLATVQRIVHRHGGRVWVESEIDQGAVFYFTIPE